MVETLRGGGLATGRLFLGIAGLFLDRLAHPYQDSRRQFVEEQFLHKSSEAHCLGYSPDDDANTRKKLAILREKFKQTFIADLEQGEEPGHIRYKNMMSCFISHCRH